jgi:cell wall-associated NlpC family hydrolase
MSCRQEPKLVYTTPIYSEFRLPADTTTRVIPKDTVLRTQIVAFAKTLIGTPYKFGCTAPSIGFDCSGFITYVFNHFNITVPRSSVDFTNEGDPVVLGNARPADLILFTGTNSKIRTVGHIGIIYSNDTSGISFIQSTSGKEYGVTITPLNGHYLTRFVKVIRIIK